MPMRAMVMMMRRRRKRPKNDKSLGKQTSGKYIVGCRLARILALEQTSFEKYKLKKMPKQIRFVEDKYISALRNTHNKTYS